jgi:hypothetical protein
MLTEKEMLDAMIERWVRFREIADKRIRTLEQLRSQLDTADLRGFIDDLRGIDDAFAGPGHHEEPAAVGPSKESRAVVAGASIGRDGAKQIRGDRNPNRLRILELATAGAVSVPDLWRRFRADGNPLTKQAIDAWVRKLVEEGLLVREASPDSSAKHVFRRSEVR